MEPRGDSISWYARSSSAISEKEKQGVTNSIEGNESLEINYEINLSTLFQALRARERKFGRTIKEERQYHNLKICCFDRWWHMKEKAHVISLRSIRYPVIWHEEMRGLITQLASKYQVSMLDEANWKRDVVRNEIEKTIYRLMTRSRNMKKWTLSN